MRQIRRVDFVQSIEHLRNQLSHGRYAGNELPLHVPVQVIIEFDGPGQILGDEAAVAGRVESAAQFDRMVRVPIAQPRQDVHFVVGQDLGALGQRLDDDQPGGLVTSQIRFGATAFSQWLNELEILRTERRSG